MCRSEPANTGHSPDAVSMLSHRRRRWVNIETAMGECPVFAGVYLTGVIDMRCGCDAIIAGVTGAGRQYT